MKKLKLSFSQARECVYRVYEKRGYTGGSELIEMLNKLGVINLENRSKLKNMINTLTLTELGKNRIRRQKNKILKKIKKNGTF